MNSTGQFFSNCLQSLNKLSDYSDTLGTLFRQLTPPCMNTYMSTPGNTAKLGTAHSNIQTAQSNPSLVGSEPTMH